MRRTALILLGCLLLLSVSVAPALASEDEMCASGAAFGQMHAEHARDGMLGGDMNPGMHRGFSVCLR